MATHSKFISDVFLQGKVEYPGIGHETIPGQVRLCSEKPGLVEGSLPLARGWELDEL